jgi:acyl-CoA synthetase (AMP-forming)/AMP-acid ligase II
VHLADAFEAAALRGPDRPFLVSLSRRLWYAQADREARARAAGFRDLGIEAGDRIAVILPNRPEWVTTLLATAQLGGTVLPVNPALGYHLDFAREQVANHKVPDVVRCFDVLPLTASGKVGRRELGQVVALELTAS